MSKSNKARHDINNYVTIGFYYTMNCFKGAIKINFIVILYSFMRKMPVHTGIVYITQTILLKKIYFIILLKRVTI